MNWKRKAHVKNGAFSLLVAAVLFGYGLFRYSHRPVLGGWLMMVGLLSAAIGVTNFALAIYWSDP